MWNKIRYQGDADDVRALRKEYEVDGFLDARLAGEREERSRLRGDLLQKGVLLSQALSPRIFAIAGSVLDKLEVLGGFDVICLKDPSINAFASVEQAETGDDQFIGITSGALELLDDGEIAFILGHEIGHILFEHNRMNGLLNLDPNNNRKTVLPYMGEGLFLRWQKKREISADRVGLIACGSFEDAARALLKAGYGLSEKNLNLDVASLMEQLEGLRDNPAAVQSNFQSHPLLPLRLRALYEFDKRLTESLTLKALESCDQEVDELFSWFKKYPRTPLDEAVMRIVAIAGLRLAHVDGDPDEEELSSLLYVLHQCFTEEPAQELCLSREEQDVRWKEAVALLLKEGQPSHTQFILSRLAEVAIADGKLMKKEAGMILAVAEQLHFKSQDAYQIIVSAAQNVGFQEDRRMVNTVGRVQDFMSSTHLGVV